MYFFSHISASTEGYKMESQSLFCHSKGSWRRHRKPRTQSPHSPHQFYFLTQSLAAQILKKPLKILEQGRDYPTKMAEKKKSMSVEPSHHCLDLKELTQVFLAFKKDSLHWYKSKQLHWFQLSYMSSLCTKFYSHLHGFKSRAISSVSVNTSDLH